MTDGSQLELDQAVDLLRASGETTRMRLLALLAVSDLTVSDLTDILGQSQPRISRHLKLLTDVGLVDRYQEGTWAFFRLANGGSPSVFARDMIARLSTADPVLRRDHERLSAVRELRAAKAAEYFSRNAAEWDRLRSLQLPDRDVEEKLAEIAGETRFDTLLDLGTGTGRMLVLLADRYRRGIGIDSNSEMLAVARANLDAAGVTHAQVRRGDIANLPVERESADLIVIHQVLHYLSDPLPALREAARALRPGARMLIVDFAPHQLDFLREEHAHARLGFEHSKIAGWAERVGLICDGVTDLHPGQQRGGELTVTIWSVRDPRAAIGNQGHIRTQAA